jgi:hypothetical protein
MGEGRLGNWGINALQSSTVHPVKLGHALPFDDVIVSQELLFVLVRIVVGCVVVGYPLEVLVVEVLLTLPLELLVELLLEEAPLEVLLVVLLNDVEGVFEAEEDGFEVQLAILVSDCVPQLP